MIFYTNYLKKQWPNMIDFLNFVEAFCISLLEFLVFHYLPQRHYKNLMKF